MDFLLESYRRQRKWIWLKQLLLLLLRMAAVALVVAMLAHLVSSQQWWRLFTAATTHHYVILDDSMSMGDEQPGGSAFDAAQQVIGQLIQLASQQTTPQKLTLVRYSRATLANADPSETSTSAASSEQVAAPADWLQRTIELDADLQWEELRRRLSVTQLAAGPAQALSLVRRWTAQAEDETPVVYLLSDFRSRDWQQPGEVAEQLQALADRECRIQMVRCVTERHANLAITRLEPSAGTLAAGVPLFVEVAVTNFGDSDADNVQVGFRTWEYLPKDEQPQPVVQLPSLSIDRIEAGQTVVRRAQVHFGIAGKHVVEATLAEDPLEADNRRWCVVHLPDYLGVLIVDGDPQQRGAFYLRSVFTPGERAVTGIRPRVEPLSFLRDATDEQLAEFSAIYLLDVPQLAEDTARRLLQYLRRGGGIVLAFGPETDLNSYRQLQTVTPELIPVKLLTPGQLPATAQQGQPDLLVEDHPIFRVLVSRGGQANPLAGQIRVRQFYRTEPIATDDQAAMQVVARLRDGSPLVVENLVGQGRLMVWLTTLGPPWNNWAQHPTFPVIVLQQQAHVGAHRQQSAPLKTGAPVRVALDPRQYHGDVEFLLPSPPDVPPQRVRKSLSAQAASDETALLELGADARGSRTGETDTSGVYSIVLKNLQGELEYDRVAVNVESAEGDLQLADRERLEQFASSISGQLHDVGDVSFVTLEEQASSWSRLLLWILLGVLVTEQLVAFSASYHARQEVTW